MKLHIKEIDIIADFRKNSHFQNREDLFVNRNNRALLIYSQHPKENFQSYINWQKSI